MEQLDSNLYPNNQNPNRDQVPPPDQMPPPGQVPLPNGQGSSKKTKFWLAILLVLVITLGLVVGFSRFRNKAKTASQLPYPAEQVTPTLPVQIPGGLQSGKAVKLCGEWPKFGEAVSGVNTLPQGFPLDFPLPAQAKAVAGLSGGSRVAYLCADLTVREVFDFYKNSKTSWLIQGGLAAPGEFGNPYSVNTQRLEGEKLADLPYSGEQMVILFYEVGPGKTLIDLTYSPSQFLGE